MATRTSNATELEDLRAQLKQLQGEFKELTSLSKQLAAEKASDWTNRTKDIYRAGIDKVGEVQEDVADQVRANPLKAVLIAAGVGLVLGCLSRR